MAPLSRTETKLTIFLLFIFFAGQLAFVLKTSHFNDIGFLRRTHGTDDAVALYSPPPAFDGLEPEAVWRFFGQLTQIPRPSKEEGKVLGFLVGFAEARGLEWVQDKAGNLVIRKPGCNGGESAPPVVIQGHVDMVCEKNKGSTHDFSKDPLSVQLQGDWIKAEGTTLGADNGLGVAVALALLDMDNSSRALPPLECLFTVDEETGLHGAMDLDSSIVKGKMILNLDTEDWGTIFVGSAGGGDSRIHLPLARELAPPEGYQYYSLKISGLMGGHSGLNIHEDRANAVVSLARLLDYLFSPDKNFDEMEIGLVSLEGGDKHNAIPREAVATICIPFDNAAEIAGKIQMWAEGMKLEYGELEKNLQVALDATSIAQDVPPLTRQSTHAALTLLLGLPQGPLKHSHALPGLVETSSNVAKVNLPAASSSSMAALDVLCSTRSSVSHALEATRRQIRRMVATAAVMAGVPAPSLIRGFDDGGIDDTKSENVATCEQNPAYPGWQPDLSSNVLAVTQSCLEDIIGHKPEVLAVHAGLECGILKEKISGADVVSFGPTIKGAHSPDERLQVSTVAPFWELVLKVLEKLAIAEA